MAVIGKMKVVYEPDNLAGAEAYIVMTGVVDKHSVRRWLEEKTIRALKAAKDPSEGWAVAYKGLGFFHGFQADGTYPSFELAYEPNEIQEFQKNSVIWVKFWIPAEDYPTVNQRLDS